nr:hypothetical protein [uncultured Allomuricauda sp.]
MLGVPVIKDFSEDKLKFPIMMLLDYHKDCLNVDNYPDYYAHDLYRANESDNLFFAKRELAQIKKFEKVVREILEHYKVEVSRIPFNYDPTLRTWEHPLIVNEKASQLACLRNDLIKIKAFLENKIALLAIASKQNSISVESFTPEHDSDKREIKYDYTISDIALYCYLLEIPVEKNTDATKIFEIEHLLDGRKGSGLYNLKMKIPNRHNLLNNRGETQNKNFGKRLNKVANLLEKDGFAKEATQARVYLDKFKRKFDLDLNF